MKKNKKLLMIGRPENAALLQMYGAEVLIVRDAEEINQVVKTIEENIDAYGIILIEAKLFTGEKMIKKLRSLGIPVLPIPTHRSEAMVAFKNMEHMVTKAVGMSLDFLK